MVVQKAIKSYPMVKWFVLAAVVVVAVGVWMSNILTSEPDKMGLFVGSLVLAAVLCFLSLAFPRREVVTMELPTDTLVNRPKAELEAILTGLDEAKARGEMDDDRYTKARAKVTAAMKGKQ